MLYADYDSLIIQQISSHEVGSGTHHMRLPYKTKITRTAQKYKIFPPVAWHAYHIMLCNQSCRGQIFRGHRCMLGWQLSENWVKTNTVSFLILVRNLSGKQTFQSFLLSLVTHLLLGSTFRDFSWGTEVVQCLTLIHNAATIIQLHCNCSSHARMQVGLCYCTSHQFIQTPAEETFFCLKSRVKKTKQKSAAVLLHKHFF